MSTRDRGSVRNRTINKKGRSLFGVAGRPTASLPDYSNASHALKASKWQWTPAKLKTCLSLSSRPPSRVA